MAENDSNTLRVDAKIFVSAKKYLRKKKFPDTCGHGLTLRFVGKKHEACPLFKTQLEMSACRVLNHCKKLGPKLKRVRTFSK